MNSDSLSLRSTIRAAVLPHALRSLQTPPWLPALCAVLILTFGPALVAAHAQTAHFAPARNGIAGTPGNSLAHADAQVLPVTASNGNFGSVSVGSTSAAPVSLIFTFETMQMVSSIIVSTQGATGLDFSDAGTGTCKVGTTYAPGTTCTVDVNFSPKFAGTRYGAAKLINGSGKYVLATGYVQGIGIGPQVNFLPATQSVIVTDSPPYAWFAGVAVDGSGNVYVSDFGLGWVLKETPSAGGYTQSVVVDNLNSPTEIAVDGSGNVYIYVIYSNQILKETPSATGYTQSVVVTLSAWESSQSIAVDGSGNVYITDVGGNQVLKETPSASGYTESVVANGTKNGLDLPTAIAVDGNGNVYIGDWHNWRVVKETPSADGYIQSVVADNATNGLKYPTALMVDGLGNLYIDDWDNNRILKETPSAGGYIQSVAPIYGIGAMDGRGNIYIADSSNYRILKEDCADPPRLAFALTTAGTTSIDSPKMVTVENVGNAPLIFPATGTGTGDNPSVPANFAWDPSSTCVQTTASSPAAFQLAGGASCTMAFDFKPATAAGFNVHADLRDNSLNMTNALQGIQLSGTAVLASQTITFPQPASPVYFGVAPITLSATGGASGNPVIFRVSSGPASQSGTNGSILNVTGWGTIVVTAYQAGNSTYPAAQPVTRNITVLYSKLAALTAPAPGSTLTGANATFSWSPGVGATQYMLYLGTTGVRSSNLYNSGPTTATSVNVTGLPINGGTIYARLYSLIGGAWHALDYTYKAAPLQTTLISPVPNSTLTGSSVTFTWAAASGATKYALYLGSYGAGSDNLYRSGYTAATAVNVTGLPVNGEKIYARLYWYAGGAWQYLDYTYTAYTAR